MEKKDLQFSPTTEPEFFEVMTLEKLIKKYQKEVVIHGITLSIFAVLALIVLKEEEYSILILLSILTLIEIGLTAQATHNLIKTELEMNEQNSDAESFF